MIRRGMWCVTQDGKVGIANAIAPGGAVEFHQVDERGLTELIYPVDDATLVQARLREIPKARQNLSKKQFAALGYA